MYKGLPAPWDLESGILLSESRILLTIRIWNPRSSTGKESKSGIHGQAPLIDEKFEIQNQEIGIHSLKSRIQGYLGLPYKYVGRFLWHLPLAVWLNLKSFHFAGLLLLVLFPVRKISVKFPRICWKIFWWKARKSGTWSWFPLECSVKFVFFVALPLTCLKMILIRERLSLFQAPFPKSLSYIFACFNLRFILTIWKPATGWERLKRTFPACAKHQSVNETLNKLHHNTVTKWMAPWGLYLLVLVFNGLQSVADPDLQIRGVPRHPDPDISGGGGSPKNYFPALRASVWSKNKGRRAPWAPPLDPPLTITELEFGVKIQRGQNANNFTFPFKNILIQQPFVYLRLFRSLSCSCSWWQSKENKANGLISVFFPILFSGGVGTSIGSSVAAKK